MFIGGQHFLRRRRGHPGTIQTPNATSKNPYRLRCLWDKIIGQGAGLISAFRTGIMPKPVHWSQELRLKEKKRTGQDLIGPVGLKGTASLGPWTSARRPRPVGLLGPVGLGPAPAPSLNFQNQTVCLLVVACCCLASLWT